MAYIKQQFYYLRIAYLNLAKIQSKKDQIWKWVAQKILQ